MVFIIFSENFDLWTIRTFYLFLKPFWFLVFIKSRKKLRKSFTFYPEAIPLKCLKSLLFVMLSVKNVNAKETVMFQTLQKWLFSDLISCSWSAPFAAAVFVEGRFAHLYFGPFSLMNFEQNFTKNFETFTLFFVFCPVCIWFNWVLQWIDFWWNINRVYDEEFINRVFIEVFINRIYDEEKSFVTFSCFSVRLKLLRDLILSVPCFQKRFSFWKILQSAWIFFELFRSFR